MYKTNELFDLSKTRAADLLRECEYPWQALDKIGETPVYSRLSDLAPIIT